MPELYYSPANSIEYDQYTGSFTQTSLDTPLLITSSLDINGSAEVIDSNLIDSTHYRQSGDVGRFAIVYRAVDDGLGGDAALATTNIYAQPIRDDTTIGGTISLDGDPVKPIHPQNSQRLHSSR